MKTLLPDYLEHMVRTPETLLCRVAGLFRLVSGKRSVFIMVQRCGFLGSDVTEIHDVSGKGGSSAAAKKPKADEIKESKLDPAAAASSSSITFSSTSTTSSTSTSSSSSSSATASSFTDLPPVQRDFDLNRKLLMSSSTAVSFMTQLCTDLEVGSGGVVVWWCGRREMACSL
jgi:Phosphatidylinositol-4-phosphate 5-Kinase